MDVPVIPESADPTLQTPFADTAGWELLVRLAREAGETEMAGTGVA